MIRSDWFAFQRFSSTRKKKSRKMPIIDKELVDETPFETMKTCDQSLGDYLLGIVEANLAQYGDSQWMVSPISGESIRPSIDNRESIDMFSTMLQPAKPSCTVKC